MADGKWIEGLSPEMRVSEAAAVVLAARFEVVRHFLPLAVEKPYDDPEYVHQLRVGTRRAGAALRAFPDCLPRKHLRSAKQSLRTIRRAAGDARDWDVFLLALPTSKALSGASGRPALDYLAGYAMGERTAAQARLAEAAAANGPTFVEESLALPGLVHEPKRDNPPANFADLASDQLGTLLAAFNEAVEANPTQPAALHRLRILGKRLRYALEIFADCFPPAFKDTLYPAVERLQDLLGDIQDASVGTERLGKLRDRIKQSVPDEWPRLRKGFEGQIKALRAKIPAGRKAFQKWRKEWSGLVADVKLEVVAATVTA
jgi:CHAD domain-containing protein